ncbi:hypothetical protein [Streptomyces sp. NBC_00076]|uniref:hypothetical protein n=1 Tax=Streptomyces sp. NBC_00076 TaxID=2975642 RepID=UPI003246BE0A
MNPLRPKPTSPSLPGVCLVTGGAAGIGWALTRALAAAGSHMYVGDNSRTGLERAAAWDHLVEIWPAYVSFAQRSGRRLRIFRLAPA